VYVTFSVKNTIKIAQNYMIICN